jgi:hypothetical protein
VGRLARGAGLGVAAGYAGGRGIGALLVIMIIVLIVRTRRVV